MPLFYAIIFYVFYLLAVNLNLSELTTNNKLLHAVRSQDTVDLNQDPY